MPKGSQAKISLWWYAKTPLGWRHFPCLLEWNRDHTAYLPKHAWVRYKGQEVHYAQGRYELRTWEDGRRVYKPLDAHTPTDAMHLLKRARRVAENIGAHNPLNQVRTAVESYTRDLQQRRKVEMAEKAAYVLGEFRDFLADAVTIGRLLETTRTRDITREHMLRFHAYLRKKGNSERTIADKHQRVKAWLRFCKIETSFLPPVPKFEKTLPTIYSDAQIAALRAAADEEMRMAIDLLWMLGLREREATHAEWVDIDWQSNVFRVQGKVRPHYRFAVKDSEQREVPIPAVLLSRLQKRREAKPDTRLILSGKHDRPEGHLLRKLKALARNNGLNCGRCEGCSREGAAAECEEFELHRFRRTFCTMLLRNGIDLATAQRMMGHSDLASTMRYLRPASTIQVQDKVNAIFGD